MSLPESPFSCLCLHFLFSVSSALLFPSYWFIDRLLSCAVFTSVERSRGVGWRALCLLLGVPFFLLLFLLSLPLGFFGFLFWAPLHCTRRPFSYQNSVRTPDDPPEKILGGDCSFVFISANLCLLPDGLARFSNLHHTQSRSAAISHLLCSASGPASCEDTMPICSTEDVVPMMEIPYRKEKEADVPFEVALNFPQNADFVCLQEVFDGRASRKLRRCLGSTFPHILYDVGPSGPHGCAFKFFNSGLFLASRHPFTAAKYYIYPNARGEDAMASKGLLCVKVPRQSMLKVTYHQQNIDGEISSDLRERHVPPLRGCVWSHVLVTCGGNPGSDKIASNLPLVNMATWGRKEVHIGMTKQKQRIVGYINCTHLHAPESDAVIRCDQMSLLLRWVLDFQSQYCEDGDLVAFDVLCGDLNFDNCSTDDCMEQKHQLFSVYKDPCRDAAGQDRWGTVGTLLRADCLYHEAVNTPASLKRTLDSEAERKLYVAPPLPDGIDGTGAHWTGRRIDYILHRESDSLLPLVVNKFQFITQLAGLSDHIPVSMHFSVSLPEGPSL